MDYKIIPGILRDDEAEFKADVERARAITDYIQIDVLDGQFTPYMTVQQESIRTYASDLKLEIQLLTKYPEEQIDEFLLPNTEVIIAPIESVRTPRELIGRIHDNGKKVGFSLNLETKPDSLRNLPYFDKITVMAILPGAQGQTFHPEIMPKIAALRHDFPSVDIEVDGGINETTLKMAIDAGANHFIAGSFIFKTGEPKAQYQKLVDLLPK